MIFQKIVFAILISLLLSTGIHASPSISKKNVGTMSSTLLTLKSTKKISMRQQYTAEKCLFGSKTCVSPRICADAADGSEVIPCSSSSNRCLCIEPTGDRFCTSSAQCLSKDRCILAKKTKQKFCFSCKLSELVSSTKYEMVDSGADSCNRADNIPPSGSNNGGTNPCIAISSLRNMDRSQFIYSTDRKAGVFCDVHENCATPGHIVEHKGSIMMMSTYCATIGSCTKKVKLVNSPRMSYGLRIESAVEHLKFTAMSARYETKAEEKLMQALARLGV